jgi:two-component system NtrC family sensor kinase
VQADRALFARYAAERRKSYALEKRYIRKDGQIVQAALSVTEIQVKEGAPRVLLAIVEDVTEKKRAQEALIQSEKLAATGRLAASLAHEINNPLQAVIGCLDLVEDALAQGTDAGHYLEVAQQELDRAARVVRQLRDLHRRSGGAQREPTDVKKLLERVLEVAAGQCKRRRVEVEWQCVDDLPAISAVPDQLQQLFLNLVLNAVDAMPDGGQLCVTAARTVLPEGIQMRFVDTGSGIPAGDLPRLFEPFYTTRSDGLGLGLYVSRNIVEHHGGRIEVESTLEQGATFTVWLPR